MSLVIERREQVFVSSTYVDLQEERREVIQALLEADCIPAGMELFPASDDDSWSLIKKVIDDSDYYVLIVGGRYGSTHPEREVSYTEMEYNYADESKKPIMAFFHGIPDVIPQGRTDKSDVAAEQLERFKARVRAARNVKTWTTPAELAGIVTRGLIHLRKAAPATGWVRGDMALTPEKEAEIAELKAELAEARQLQAEATSQSADLSQLEDLAQGDDEYDLPFSIEHGPAFARKVRDFSWSPSWNEIFAELGPTMLREASQEKLLIQLSEWCIREAREYTERNDDDIEVGERPRASFEGKHLDDLVVQLHALRLIEESTHRHGVNDKNVYWSLTLRGRELLTNLRAIRRASPEDAARGADGPTAGAESSVLDLGY